MQFHTEGLYKVYTRFHCFNYIYFCPIVLYFDLFY